VNPERSSAGEVRSGIFRGPAKFSGGHGEAFVRRLPPLLVYMANVHSEGWSVVRLRRGSPTFDWGRGAAAEQSTAGWKMRPAGPARSLDHIARSRSYISAARRWCERVEAGAVLGPGRQRKDQGMFLIIRRRLRRIVGVLRAWRLPRGSHPTTDDRLSLGRGSRARRDRRRLTSPRPRARPCPIFFPGLRRPRHAATTSSTASSIMLGLRGLTAVRRVGSPPRPTSPQIQTDPSRSVSPELPDLRSAA